MLDLARHDSLPSALDEAFERFADRLCLIEANRDRENCRLTYAQVRDASLRLAGALRGCRRGAILMTNQSKWHVAACALLRAGAVLVPLDPKLTPKEHAALLAHSGAYTLVVEHHLWRSLVFAGKAVVTEAPPNADLRGARRFEDCAGDPPAPPRTLRGDPACIVYSSGTGGRPKGCILTHGNYLDQCASLTRLYVFEPGDRYLSVLPTNHAIDFMVGFLGPYACGATVVHLRTLRPEFVREAFPRYDIAYMALVPMLLKNLEKGLRDRIGALPAAQRFLVQRLVGLNRLLTRRRPNPRLSRLLLRPIHRAFGGRLKALFVGGAFTDPATLRFFRDLGIRVANGYGLTEAGTVVTLADFESWRPETVGRPLDGTEVRILEPDAEGIGEVLVRGNTVMAGYLDDPALTAETIVDGWLRTGDLGRLDPSGHLTLFGRRKNMIVTPGGKNVYPEDIENAFEGLPAKEYCVFASHALWPVRDERLVLVVAPEAGDGLLEELRARNRKLPDYKRVSGYVVWPGEFPRTASLKIKRDELARALRDVDPGGMVAL
jgi:long-chain acyl-CoA synthetase